MWGPSLNHSKELLSQYNPARQNILMVLKEYIITISHIGFTKIKKINKEIFAISLPKLTMGSIMNRKRKAFSENGADFRFYLIYTPVKMYKSIIE